MAGLLPCLRPVARLAVVLGLVLGSVSAAAATPARAADLAPWTGEVDLYRDGVFTTQQSWLWCTAAGVQIVRNIVAERDDHSTAAQGRYFEWMRGRNRYDLPVSAGVDPQGWTAGLRHFVDDRYRLVASASFDGAIRLAVTRLRLTSLPVALTVSHGGHGWILHGFAATADPARTKDFTITSVWVTGPLYGLQSRNGYDMAPDTELTPSQLRRFFTPWRYDPLPMIWDGKYVSIQPVPVSTASASPATEPAPSPSPAPSPAPSPSLARSAAPIAIVPATPADSTGPVGDAPAGGPAGDSIGAVAPVTWLAAAVGVAALGSLLAIFVRRRVGRR